MRWTTGTVAYTAFCLFVMVATGLLTYGALRWLIGSDWIPALAGLIVGVATANVFRQPKG